MSTSRTTKITIASAAAIAMALPAVKAYEGLWLTAKVDTIGTGRPVTACYGETENVRLGQRFTEQQCADLLAKKLVRYDAEIGRCITVELPDITRAALVSFAYNVGSAGACRSGVVREMNAGHFRAGCEALMQWTRAQGRVVQGLVNRRSKERAMCLAGLKQQPPAAPTPYVCTPRQAEAGECLPLLPPKTIPVHKKVHLAEEKRSTPVKSFWSYIFK